MSDGYEMLLELPTGFEWVYHDPFSQSPAVGAHLVWQKPAGGDPGPNGVSKARFVGVSSFDMDWLIVEHHDGGLSRVEGRLVAGFAQPIPSITVELNVDDVRWLADNAEEVAELWADHPRSDIEPFHGARLAEKCRDAITASV